MKKTVLILLLAVLTPVFTYVSCRKRPSVPQRNFLTKNVVIIFMDGARYTETWGSVDHKYIPHMSQDMAPEGVVFTNFYNNGATNTVNGHAAVTTGYYQNLGNNGQSTPDHPSIFQLYIQGSRSPSHKAWVIASKDKLEVLANSTQGGWVDNYLCKTDCGNNGLGTGYRADSITYQKAISVLQLHQPNLLLINFKEPDSHAHTGHWKNYTKGILQTDEYAWMIWEFLRNDPHYKDNTTFILTNDHGRHTDGVSTGFASHGDGCEGCRHVNLYGWGPDFRKGVVVDAEYELTDLYTTIMYLLSVGPSQNDGVVIPELYN